MLNNGIIRQMFDGAYHKGGEQENSGEYMKIGLYGGTFDPVHLGHINIARQSVEQFNLDQLWFIPAKIPPHKIKSNVSDENHRLNMLSIAVNELDNRFKVITYELDKDGISYTYLTLTDFSIKYKNNDFYYIIGEDSLNDFSKWRNPDIISSLVEIIVAPRIENNYDNIIELSEKYKDLYNSVIHILKLSVMNVSSTEIRNCIKNNVCTKNMISGGVFDYIKANNLYK